MGFDNRNFAPAAVLLAFLLAGCAQDNTSGVNVYVRDSSGVAVDGAFVTAYLSYDLGTGANDKWTGLSGTIVSTGTSKNGSVKLQIAPGNYAFTATKGGLVGGQERLVVSSSESVYITLMAQPPTTLAQGTGSPGTLPAQIIPAGSGVDIVESGGKKVASVENVNPSDAGLRNARVAVSQPAESEGYAIVNGVQLSGNETKKLYVERKNPDSAGICFADREGLETRQDVLSDCVYISCPGTLGEYSCAVEGAYFVVWGLRHSGAIEAGAPQRTLLPASAETPAPRHPITIRFVDGENRLIPMYPGLNEIKYATTRCLKEICSNIGTRTISSNPYITTATEGTYALGFTTEGYQDASLSLTVNEKTDASAVTVMLVKKKPGSPSASASGSPQENAPPTVLISGLRNGERFGYGTEIKAGVSAAAGAGKTIKDVDLFDNGVKVGEDTKAPYTFFLKGLGAGAHRLTAGASDSAGQAKTSPPINIEVAAQGSASASASAQPSDSLRVEMTAPNNDDIFIEGDSIALVAELANDMGQVERVEFYRANSKIGEAALPLDGKYIAEWKNVSSGIHSLRAKAVDNSGNAKWSGAVLISVEQANASASPSAGPKGRITAGAYVDLGPGEINVSDNAGTAEVREKATGMPIAKIHNVDRNEYYNKLKNIAIRRSGTSAAKSYIIIKNLNLDPDANESETIYIRKKSAASNGVCISDRAGLTSLADISPLNGCVRLNCPGILGKYSCTVQDSTYAVTGMTHSGISEDTVPNSPPTVSITSPANNATFTAPAAATITAGASDIDGTVLKVEFYSGTSKLGEDTSSPYSFAWNSAGIGTYSLGAKAIDNNGAISSSASVAVTVSAPPAAPTAAAPGGTGTEPPVVAAPANTTKAIINSVEISPLFTGQAGKITAKITNLRLADQKFTIQASIKDKNRAEKFSGSMKTETVARGASLTVDFTKKWTPEKEGAYELTVTLSSENGTAKYGTRVTNVTVAKGTPAPQQQQPEQPQPPAQKPQAKATDTATVQNPQGAKNSAAGTGLPGQQGRQGQQPDAGAPSGNNDLIMLAGIAVVALIAIAGIGFFLLKGRPPTQPEQGANPSPNPAQGEETKRILDQLEKKL